MKALKKALLIMLAAVLLASAVSCSGKTNQSADAIVMSADEAFSAAKRGNIVVFDNSCCVSGRSIWDEFCAAVDNGKPANVLCAYYYTLDPERTAPELYEAEKDSYPRLYFTLLEYDGRRFTYHTRLSSEQEADDSGEYACMLHFTGDMNPQAKYRHYEYYVLVNDDTLTWDDIEHGMFSSQLGDYISHLTVFTNYSD